MCAPRIADLTPAAKVYPKIDPAFLRKPGGGEAVLAESVPVWKRVLDVCLILLALPGIVPICILIALYIKWVSRGPILFRQERIGFRCRPFHCLKFRSMHAGADSTVHRTHLNQLMASDAPLTKMDRGGDARLIPFGRLFRASGLDELPQLWNVIRGEMSLVGPRPCTRYEFEHYAPWQKARFDTLPGLTGLWQVSGKNKTTFTEMIKLDICYAKSPSLSLDLRILFLTVPAMFAQCREVAPRAYGSGKTLAAG